MTPEQLVANNPAAWAVLNKIRLQSEVFSLYPSHAYQAKPMTAWPRRVCYMKATGLGFSEMEILKSLHGMIHRRYKQGCLYLFPTSDDVGEFSKSRFNPLIQSNPGSIGRFVKEGGKGADTTRYKRVGSGNLYIRGARLTQSMEGGSDEKFASKLTGIQVDRVVFDEIDLMDDDAVAQALMRMGNSEIKDEVYIGNPTIPGYGIDRKFSHSDQRYWFRRCGCGAWTCAEETFPDCVRMGKNGRGYIACMKCGNPVPIYAGEGTAEWVAKRPEVKDLEGYSLSHLSSARQDPMDVLKEYNDPNNLNRSNTIRLRLGRADVASEARLSPGQVLECCGTETMLQRHTGPCAMGVDIGREFHVVIGIRTGKDRYEILRLTRIPCSASDVTMQSAWNAVHDLARAFNVRSAVVDIRPYEHQAREFRKSESYRVLLCEYTENGLVEIAVNNDTGVVKVYRTGICDTTHRVIAEGAVKLPRRNPEVEIFARHASNMAKILKTDEKTGKAVYRYIKTGDDHYRHAMNCFWLAAQGLSVAFPYGWPARPRQAISEYQRI